MTPPKPIDRVAQVVQEELEQSLTSTGSVADMSYFGRRVAYALTQDGLHWWPQIIQRLDVAYCSDCNIRMPRSMRHPHPLRPVRLFVVADDGHT